MGPRRFRPLRPSEIIRVLRKFKFSYKHSTGDHDYYEGIIESRRRVVTIPNYSEIKDPGLMKSIIEQSGIRREEFYGEEIHQDEAVALPYKKCDRCNGKGNFRPENAKNLSAEIIWPLCKTCNGSGDGNNPAPQPV